MKRQIRRGVFETNSSSVHSLTMCDKTEFEKWKRGEVLFWKNRDKFGTKDDFIEELQNYRYSWGDRRLVYPDVDWSDDKQVHDIFSDEGICSHDYYFDEMNYDYETYWDSFTTKSGDEIVAFGYYGRG